MHCKVEYNGFRAVYAGQTNVDYPGTTNSKGNLTRKNIRGHLYGAVAAIYANTNLPYLICY